MPGLKKKLLLSCTLDPCGHHFECWTETATDGSWSLHFHAPCAEGKQIARDIAARTYPHKLLILAR